MGVLLGRKGSDKRLFILFVLFHFISLLFVIHPSVNMHPAIAGLISAASLLGYSQGSNEVCFFGGVCGGRRFSKDIVTSCAFSSYYANPSSMFTHLTTKRRFNSPSVKVACSSRALSATRSVALGLLTSRAASTTSIESLPENDDEPVKEQQQYTRKGLNERVVIIIGGTGFLGTEIRHQLQERGMNFIATTTPSTYRNMNEKGNFVPLYLTAENAQQDFYDIISTVMKADDRYAKEIAVIAAMGTIGTKDDEKVNAALAEAIKGAHRVNVKNDDDVVKSFVMIGNTKRVRRLARRVSFLKGYAEGKDEAEATLQDLFGKNACIIKVRYIWGIVVIVCCVSSM